MPGAQAGGKAATVGEWTDAEGGAVKAATGAERRLSPPAERALAEAEERRRAALAGFDGAGDAASGGGGAREVGGRDGPDPVRYGDWEVKGIAADF